MPVPDPTNARLRDFDVPVIMPRIDLIALPDDAETVHTGDWDASPALDGSA